MRRAQKIDNKVMYSEKKGSRALTLLLIIKEILRYINPLFFLREDSALILSGYDNRNSNSQSSRVARPKQPMLGLDDSPPPMFTLFERTLLALNTHSSRLGQLAMSKARSDDRALEINRQDAIAWRMIPILETEQEPLQLPRSSTNSTNVVPN